ncbi:MAG: HEAT repeat domain-containing protein [Candidatus Caldatribacterium sp.]|nr:HEAT repeat domain-containing protein [Candidatus Caldatribacterium sp.]
MPEKVVALFCSPDLSLRNAAVAILASQWQAPLEVLARSLRSPNKHIRKLALDALYALGNPIAVDIIAEALEDEDVNNVIAAIEYIAELGGRKYTGQILEILQKAEDPFLIATCFEALGKLGDSHATKAVQELFPNPAELPEFLIPSYLRFVAGCGSREHLPKVCCLVTRWGQLFYKEILDALSALLTRSDTIDPSEQQTVGDCLKEMLQFAIPSPNKYEILLLLARIDREGVIHEVQAFLQSDDPLLRIAALEVIAEAEITSFHDAVQALLAAETNEDVRQCAQYVLERLGRTT